MFITYTVFTPPMLFIFQTWVSKQHEERSLKLCFSGEIDTLTDSTDDILSNTVATFPNAN